MIPVLYPYLTWSDLCAFFTIGKNVDNEFEKKLSEKFKVKYSLTFSSGRAGLYHILKSNNIENKKVLVTAYTCCVVTEAISQSGNKIVFIDTNGESFNAEILEENLNKYKSNLGAVIITNLFGFSDDYKKLEFLAKKRNFLVIIDDALSPLDVSQVPKEIFDYIYTSCGVRKPFTCLGGGIVLTNDTEQFKLLYDYVI